MRSVPLRAFLSLFYFAEPLANLLTGADLDRDPRYRSSNRPRPDQEAGGLTASLLRREGLVPLLRDLAETLEVVAPILVDGSAVFATWRGEEPALKADNPLNSPVEFFLPKREVLFRYVQYSGRYTFAEEPPKARLIFGMRPCDLRALEVLDRLFGAEIPDHPYLARRRSPVVVVLNCTIPGERCLSHHLGRGSRTPVDDGRH